MGLDPTEGSNWCHFLASTQHYRQVLESSFPSSCRKAFVTVVVFIRTEKRKKVSNEEEGRDSKQE